MPVGIIGAAVGAGEFAYDAYNAGSNTGPGAPAPVALTPQEEKFFEMQSLQAQQDSENQTAAVEKAANQSAAGNDFLKWGVGISVAWLLWKVAKHRRWV